MHPLHNLPCIIVCTFARDANNDKLMYDNCFQARNHTNARYVRRGSVPLRIWKPTLDCTLAKSRTLATFAPPNSPSSSISSCTRGCTRTSDPTPVRAATRSTSARAVSGLIGRQRVADRTTSRTSLRSPRPLARRRITNTVPTWMLVSMMSTDTSRYSRISQEASTLREIQEWLPLA